MHNKQKNFQQRMFVYQFSGFLVLENNISMDKK